MSASSTPSSGDNQPSRATDPLAWRRHLPALTLAVSGINEACDAWDAVSDSLCDADGRPLDNKVYGDRKVKRDAEAWKHAEVFLDHGPEVLAGVRAAADGPDYVEGPISHDLRRIRGLDNILFRAEEMRHKWDSVMALIDGSQPSVLHLYRERAEEHRNTHGWRYSHELGFKGTALVRVGEYPAHRADTERPAQTERARVALTRSTHDAPAGSPASPQAPPASQPSAPGRSR
ncbi:hypothetical protein ACWGUJ_30335 [Streptomyces albidoflavus]